MLRLPRRKSGPPWRRKAVARRRTSDWERFASLETALIGVDARPGRYSEETGPGWRGRHRLVDSEDRGHRAKTSSMLQMPGDWAYKQDLHVQGGQGVPVSLKCVRSIIYFKYTRRIATATLRPHCLIISIHKLISTC